MLYVTAQAQTCLPLKLRYDRPAYYFEESLPIGNGRLGALVYGDTDDERIYLNDITFWTGKPVDHEEDKEANNYLPLIRKALFLEDYRTADSLQLQLQGHNSQFYQPLGIIRLTDNNTNPTTGYRRSLDLDSALAKVTYKKGDNTYTPEYFA